jgi:GTP1/Obg family GTP-binding protein
VRAAQAAVDYVRSELASVAAQLPDAADLDWRSEAQRRFRHRLDELTATIGQAMRALDHAADGLSRLPMTDGSLVPAPGASERPRGSALEGSRRT